MASAVDICNLALSHLGDEATVSAISPTPDGSVQAMHCARFYPIARDSLLEMHPWKFALRRVDLSALAVNSYGWAFAYATPKCIKALSVLAPDDDTNAKSQPYEMASASDGTEIILTNLNEAQLLYIAQVTDTTKFSPLFVDALSWLLASYLAGPIIKGDTGMQIARNCYTNFRMAFSLATVSDANQQKADIEHTPDWIGNR